MISGQWNPLAFFIDRTFCDANAIRNALRLVALRYNSRRAMLIVIRKRRIQRSLAIVFDEDGTIARDIERRLYQTINHELSPPARLLVLDRQPIDCSIGELFQFGAEETEVLKILITGLPSSGRVRTASCRELCFPDARNEALEAFVILLDCDDSAFNPVDFYSLSEMIAASVTVMVQDQVELENLHRRTVSVPVPANHFSNSVTENPSRQYDIMMEDIIGRFRELVSGDAAILMHRQRKKGSNNNWQQFTPVAVVSHEARIVADSLTKLARCRSIEFASQKNRSLLFNRSTEESTDMCFQFSVGDIEACLNQKIDSILITPLGSTDDQFILVTIRSWLDGTSNAFSSNDLGASLETVRTVFAKHRVAKSGLAFLELEKMLASPYSTTDLPVLASSLKAASEPTKPQARIPMDLSMAYHAIQELLKIASDATGSHSATFRLVSADKRALVRIVSALDETKNHSNSEIDLESMAITAVVAREGVVIYEPDITRLIRKDLRPIKIPQRSSRAEFCLPVFLSGMLIGVLNFEHRVENAYDEWEHLLELVAVSIGQQLALSRRAIDSQFLRSIPSIWDLEHMRNHAAGFLAFLNKRHQEIKFISQEIEREFHTKKCDLQTEIDAHISRVGVNSPAADLVTTLNRVLVGELYHYDIARHSIPIRNEISITEMNVSELTTRALEVTGDSISRNLTDHGNWTAVTFKHDIVRIGGREFFKLVITSPTEERPDDLDVDEFNRTVYRLPYRQNDQDRMHFGCYIAGRAIREVGGDIHGEFIEHDDCTFQSTLYIPVQ